MQVKDEKIILIGGGAQAREYYDWFGRGPDGLKIYGYLDDSSETQISNSKYQVNYLGKILDYKPNQNERFVFALSDIKIRIELFPVLKEKGFIFRNLIHPTALIAASAELGTGIVVCPYSIISSDAKIGDHVAINFHCSIGHDVKLGSFSIVSSHTDLTGGVQVEQGVFFGSSAKVIPNITIGANSVIGAGTTVIRSVKPNSTLYSALSRSL